MNVRQAIASIIAANESIPLINTPTNTVEVGELLNERATNSKVFNLGNGRKKAKIYSCPVHYNDCGVFKSIDTAVKRKPLADSLQQFQYETKSGVYHAHFNAIKPWNYRFVVGNNWIEYEALFNESDALTIDVFTNKVGVKEIITLKNNTALTSLSWNICQSGSGIITLLPTARDIKGRNIPIAVRHNNGVLTYDVDITNAVFPVIIDPSTNVTATNDGTVWHTNAVWATARDTAVADYTYTPGIILDHYLSVTYYVARGFLQFPINIANLGTVTAATLYLEGNTDGSITDFDIYVVKGTQSGTLATDMFNDFTGWTQAGAHNPTYWSGAWNTSGYSADWNTIDFNATGLAAILAANGGTLPVCILEKQSDIDNVAPLDASNVIFESSETADKEPYLAITYTLLKIDKAIDVTLEVEATSTKIVDLVFSATPTFETEIEDTKIVDLLFGYELTDWLYCKLITIDSSVIDETLTDFTVTIILDSTSFNFSLARSDGFDIRFTSLDARTLFKFERVSHDTVNELAEYHIKIPTILDSVDTQFRMPYGKADAADAAVSASAWTDNDKMVQHMNDNPDTSHITDSTQYGNNGTKKGANEPLEVDGLIGKAQFFDGNDDKITGFGNILNQSTNDFAIGASVKSTDTLSGPNSNMIVNKRSTVYNYNAGYQLNFINGEFAFRIADGTNTVVLTTTSGNAYKDDAYHRVWAVADRGTELRIYVDGVSVTSIAETTVGDITSTTYFGIGALDISLGYHFFNGTLDDIRIINTKPSVAWIKAEYYDEINQLLTIEDGSIDMLPEIDMITESIKTMDIILAGGATIESEASSTKLVSLINTFTSIVEPEVSSSKALKTTFTPTVEIEAESTKIIDFVKTFIPTVEVEAYGEDHRRSESTFKIKPQDIASLINHTNLSPDDMNRIFISIAARINAMLDTKTGHFHDSIDSHSQSGGNYSAADLEAMLLMGVLR